MNAFRAILLGLPLSLALWAGIAYCSQQAFAQRAPREFRGPISVQVQFESAIGVQAICSIITSGRLQNVEACGNAQRLILPDPCTYPGRYAEVVCHEIGHARGWSADHGGGA